MRILPHPNCPHRSTCLQVRRTHVDEVSGVFLSLRWHLRTQFSHFAFTHSVSPDKKISLPWLHATSWRATGRAGLRVARLHIQWIRTCCARVDSDRVVDRVDTYLRRDAEQMSARHILNVSIGYFFAPLFTVGGVSQMCAFPWWVQPTYFMWFIFNTPFGMIILFSHCCLKSSVRVGKIRKRGETELFMWGTLFLTSNI